MLSLNQAIEIKESILAYLKATFTFQDKKVHKAFYDFINHPQEGLFKGPYLSLKLPFVKASEEAQEQIPLDIKPEWKAYDHQLKAWERLSTKDRIPKPTIITTGTGSGKTESFMYPILDYCFNNQHRSGIKVIIMYPMNALATDQAKRLAKMIYEHDNGLLRGKITAGLFIGEGQDPTTYPKTMGLDHIIENKEAILASPPDILLTNFKMLDYGLMKSRYHDLWQGNFRDNKLLRFLVLDELHTYDGAQGTDVANLIRRLKMKLDMPEEYLIPVGTSATIGSAEDSASLLADYASKVFGENVTEEAIITENRVSTEEFFGVNEGERFIPRAKMFGKIKPITGEGYDVYFKRQCSIWQVSQSSLAEDLSGFQITRDLVHVMNEGIAYRTVAEVARALAKQNKDFKDNVPQWDPTLKINPQEALVQSLFTLITEAKLVDKNGRESPFLFSQVQLWVRELSGVLRMMTKDPRFSWKDSIQEGDAIKALPPWFCRECGASGWLAYKNDRVAKFSADVNAIYNGFFTNSKNVYFMNLTDWYSVEDISNSGYQPTDAYQRYISGESLKIFNKDKDDDGLLDVTYFRKESRNNARYVDHVCPECNTKNNVAIIGTKIATLSSIGVSQSLSSDLDSQKTQERKILAFTNSVQDAAHQASFIEARNYRFSFRSSLQKVINVLDKDVRLSDLVDKFIQYWKQYADDTGEGNLAAYYYRFYPTDYLGKSTPEDYKNGDKFEKHFQDAFDIRMCWEAYAEFGFNAVIGRTLEKTGSSGVYFEHEALLSVWDKMKVWIDKNTTHHNAIQQDDFLKFLNLLLHRIRTKGGISHPYLEKFRNGNLKLWDLNWMKDSRHFLNKRFGQRTRLPKLITYQQENRGLLDSSFTKHNNWFHGYYIKAFPLASPHTDFINDFYEQLFTILNDLEVLDKEEAKGIVNFALNPQKIFVNSKVSHVECSKCEHSINSADSIDYLVGGKCLMFRCSGTYEVASEDKTKELNYYQLVYNRNKSPRIYSAEHTGLLNREDRELLEEDFKYRTKFNSKNAIVSTSTLEMGIDIGSLNTAFNNSVPPLSSNFLQRIGRAGRSSGSALIVNFAQNKAHDQYYYREPMEMMDGSVNTPGCYLQAKEILHRHFFAFCIDSWTSQNHKTNTIPVNVKFIKIETTDVQGSEFFMSRLLNFIKANEDALLEKFRHHYIMTVEDSVFEQLKYSFASEQFYYFHKNIFQRLKEEILSLKQKVVDAKKYIKEQGWGKEDEERKELERETRNLNGIIHSLKNRSTLEYLTNIGVLPNYAFPETGVTLMGRVNGNQAEASSHPPKQLELEFVRASSVAIRELAPDNYFYAQGFKLKVTGVNTFDWSDKKHSHKKRFCSNCDHLEIEKGQKGNCPKCGSETWAASSNVHTFARLLTVKSFNNQSDAALGDNKDERENLYYNVSRHFNFSNSSSSGAWAIQDIPFGIEFVKNVTITDNNTGRTDAGSGKKVKINQEEVSGQGFVTCKHCGKSSSNLNQKDYKLHYGYCKHKDAKYQKKSDEVYEEVYFFREFQSEVLKILLPVQDFNSYSEIKMFAAGIKLGIQTYFNGNPQHIAMSDYREFNHRTLKFDRYLILFDTIPGGTGYLEKLFDHQEFNKLLQGALGKIKECSCRFLNKDGCYHCIYTYANQYDQKELSRSQAEERFEKVLDKCEGWEYYPNGLSLLTNSGKIEESELENRFYRSLKSFADKNDSWTFGVDKSYGSDSYTLVYKKDNMENFSYHIQPQYQLGQRQGIPISTRADFLIKCTSAKVNGEYIDDINSIPRIAIYLDGYQYHASEENNNFEQDFQKRMGIITSPEYKTWTLTWNDVEQFDEYFLEEENQQNRDDCLDNKLKKCSSIQNKILQATKRVLKVEYSEAQNNMERLLKVLEYPIRDETFNKSLITYLSFFQDKLFDPSFSKDDISKVFEEGLIDNYCARAKTLDCFVPFAGVAPNTLFNLKVLVNVQSNEVVSNLDFLETSQIDKEEWGMFWSLFNLIQFFDFYSKSESHLDNDGEEEIYSLEDFCGEFDDVYRPLLEAIYNKYGVDSEEDEILYYSLLDEKGETKAEAELIIPQAKIAFNPFSEEDAKKLRGEGFTIKDIDDINNITL
ncbi:DEAD/DEAH box helicase [Aureispira sp. CCB-E]|uniref:DEAD/DEAH box helicase n=1 Tax=Aureispira sp. CCB-E TaxID=3051121 RepID=UPI002868C538|nr:DEAD/DEAH box helicase [Aureispira sp. CCB-E]WMX16509.1 DEAD/DEAH box helicase [Aureispira sp. CCB-E]